MPKLISKLLISFLAGIVLVISIAPTVFAAPTPTPAGLGTALTGAAPGPWYSQSFMQWYTKVYDTSNPNEIFGERYTAAQVQWVFFGVVSFLINLATGNSGAVQQCLITAGTGDAAGCATKITEALKQVNSLFTVKTTSDNGKQQTLIGAIFEDRSLSGVTYVKDLARKFRIIPEAHAQAAPGFGYTGALGIIPDIQSAWSAIRNVAYAIFVVVIIAFAFMIMFRVKVSPQAVVTVQSALPKVAVALILVTFSYAIAGFLIDIMYVVFGIIAIIFSQFKVAGVAFDFFGANAIVGYFDMLTKGPHFAVFDTGVLGIMVMYFINYILAYIYIAIGSIFTGFLGTGGFLGGTIVGLVVLVLGLIGLIVVFIMMIINFFRVLLLLGRAFLEIILLTIFAPLMLTVGTVMPGMGFGAWIRSYISKLAVFPAVGVLFLLALWLLNIAITVIRNAATFFGGGATNFPAGWPPLLGGSPQLVSLAFLIASIAVFLMIPSAGKMIQALMSGKGFGISGGELLSPIGTIGRVAGAGIGLADVGLDAFLAWQMAQGAGRTGLGRVVGQLRGGNRNTNAPVAPPNQPIKP